MRKISRSASSRRSSESFRSFAFVTLSKRVGIFPTETAIYPGSGVYAIKAHSRSSASVTESSARRNRGNPACWILANFSISEELSVCNEDTESAPWSSGRQGCVGRNTAVRTLGPALAGWPYTTFAPATGYINYTCKYTGSRTEEDRTVRYRDMCWRPAHLAPPFTSSRSFSRLCFPSEGYTGAHA